MLYNTHNGRVLAQEVERAGSFWQRMKGLLGRRGLPAGQARFLEPCSSIHTFFMGFPIDAVFLDKERKVLHTMTNIPPFRFSPVVFQARSVVELPAGTLKATATRKGHRLRIFFPSDS